MRFIVPYPPGGSSDVLARVMGQKLTDALGRQLVIENRPGATGNGQDARGDRAQAGMIRR